MLNIRLPDALESALAQEARQRNTSRSEVARDALRFYLRVQRRQRFTKRLQQAAQRLEEAESRALAEEGLLFDNEAFAIAQASPLGVANDDKWWR